MMMIGLLRKVLFGVSISLLFIVTLFFVGVWWPLEEVEPVRNTSPIAIVNASVIDLYSGEILPEQTILIENKKIKSVGQSQTIDLSDGTIKINARNQYVMPALWDMHTHIYKVTPLLDLPLYVAYGVTNVRDMTSCPKQGDPFASCPEDLRRWNQAAVNDQLVGPRIQGISSWQLNGPGIHERMKDLPDFFGTSNAQQAREFARYYAGKVDALKIYNYIPRDAYFAVVDEARKVGLDVVGHRPHAVSAIEAAQSQKSIEHARFILHESFPGSRELRESAEKGEWKEDRRRMLDEHDPHMASAIFKAMKDAGTWYVPTHLTRRVDAYGEEPIILNDPIIKYLHPLMKWQWLEDVNKVINEEPSAEARQTYRDFYHKGLELTGDAHRAGVKVLVGTDYIVAGITVHHEMEQLTMAGLTPLEALRAATILPAEYFGLQNEYGKVAQGMSADLMLLRKNPLEDIRNSLSIESVIFNGNLYDRARLDDIEGLVERRANSWSIACKILWAFIKNPVGY
ncbi:amidohydrolase family protein [Cellvibrio sp. PSBB006]|uniref:amidohydrolase family protein n=1 Tax=Cellvibrio sp. PSBB006 TaxID=1987723 RepID=UPI000B3B7150|nr:amidohydrolase family protein [Cellvibrio sp. PSBB006]ARU29234.1 amidohydrolase [Cellvibrio sp. PSBB006]